jgi:phosphoserine phosphatase RsbU/P
LKSEEPQWLQQMGSILETLNDGVVIPEDSNQILFANAVFEEMTGTPRSEIIGTDARQLYDRAEEFALAQAFHQKALEIGRSREESFLPTKGGGRLPVVVSVRAMRRPEGGRFSIVTLTDISDQKRTEEKLRAANARLEQHQREIEQDLVLAARIQQSLAPKPFLWGNLRVDTFYQPAHTIGGDFGLVTPFKEEHLNLLVCDVSGHGISAALVANRIYSETIAQLGNRAPLADVLRRLNSLVIQNIGVQGFFFTLAVARIDRSGRTMEFAGAGHPANGDCSAGSRASPAPVPKHDSGHAAGCRGCRRHPLCTDRTRRPHCVEHGWPHRRVRLAWRNARSRRRTELCSRGLSSAIQ